MVSQSNTPISSMTPNAVPALPATVPASDTASVSNPTPTPAPAPAQGGFWNDIKNLPGQALGAVEKIPVAGKAIGTVMSWANKPLQEIQKDYKFIHSLYTDHGFGAGLLGTLAVVAGGAIGSLIGPEGTAIGAGLAGALERNILGRVVPSFQDSFNKSNDSNYLVSFGRDLAHGLSNVPGFGALANTNTGVGQVVSGIADASFDFEGDPLASLGKLKSAVKRGDNVAVATEIDAATGATKVKLDPDTGKPIARASMPFATSGGALQNFLLSNSLVVHSADQLDMALSSPMAGNVNRAIDDITSKAVNSPKTAAADIANTYGVKNGWSRTMSVALSKATSRDQVVQIFKQALYSKELADSTQSALGELKLPTRSVGKLLSEKIGPDRIKNSLQGTTFNDQVNLLVPRKSAVMDEAGNPVLNANGEQVFKTNKPALFAPGDAMNALAAKVRTFTGRRPLSFDTENMALSAKEVDMADPNLGQTIYDIAYLSMPHRVALERSSAFLTASSDEERLAMLHTLHQEVLKNFGIANAQATPLFGQLKDASVGSEADHGVYGKLDGKDIGTVDVKPEYGDAPKSMAVVVGQRYKGAMLDLKDIRQQLRSAKAYGAMYNPVDDFFTKYTNVIFAPLALLSPAFGLRVSVGEALHQVMRRGLPSYISNILATSLKGMDEKYKLYHQDKIAQGLTEADKNAIELEQAQRFYSASKEYYYRETSPYGLEDLIRTSTHEPFWFAKNKDLALGQGANKGVMLHFDIENHRATAGEGSYIGSKKVREFEGRNARKDAMNFQGDSSERSLLLNGKDAINSIDKIDFSAEQWQYLKKSKPSTLDNYKRTFIDKYNYTLRENADNSASFIREKQPARVTETEVTKELNAKENRIKSVYDAANGAISSKAAWNKAINTASDARHSIMPVGWVAGKFLKSNLASYLVKDKIKLMDEYHDVLGYRGPTAGVSSTHQASQEMAAKDQIDVFTKTRGHSMVPGQELAGLTEFDPHFHDYAAKNINMAGADMAQRDIARAYLNALKDPAFKNMSVEDQFASLVDGQAANIRNPNMYKDYRSTMDGYTKAVPESFAKSQIDYLHGIVKGANGKVNVDLVEKIAKGEQVTGKELRQRPIEEMPLSVLGRRVQPRMSDALRQVEEKGYRKFVNPVMDFVSRHPLFNDFYVRRRMANQPLIDMGLVSKDEAVRLSATQATREMIPAIHSPAIRSQFAVIHRNLLPFYFAQEQAMRRTGRLILTNPQAFRDFQIIQQGLNNPGFVHTDANGQKYIVYPGLGEFGNAVGRGLNAIGLQQFTGLPSSITGNTASLLTVLPEVKMPGTSPFINLGLSELSKKFPWMDKAVNVASGGYPSQNFIDTIIPSSTMRDLWNAMSMDDRESTVYNSKLSAIMAAYYHGDLPNNFTSLPAFQQQQILTKIEHNAQTNLIVKGLFAFFLPLAPTVSNDYYDKNMQTLRSEYLSLLNSTDPSTGTKYTAASALNKFIADNGERALSYTVARTTSGSGGAYAPLADSTVQWIGNNQAILNNPEYSTAAPYLIPQVADGKDALSVEGKLIINHFRAKVSSKDFISALYVKQGWQDISADYTAYQADMQQLRASGDKNGMYQASQIWKQISSNYGQSNPIWYSDYMNPTKIEMAQKAVTQFITMQDKGLLTSSPQGQKISQILDNYKQYHQDLLANTYNGKHLPGYGQAQDAWYTYMDNLAATDPQLASVVTGVFRRAV